MTKLILKIGGAIEIFSADDLRYIKGDSSYSILHFNDKKVVSSKTLGSFDLKEHGFIRVHKSYIINTALVTKITGAFIYIGNEEIPYSGTKTEILNKFCQDINFVKCDN